jgi:hypothetical protein
MYWWWQTVAAAAPQTLRLRQAHILTPRHEVGIEEKRADKPVRKHLWLALTRELVVTAPTQNTETAEAQAVSLAFRSLARFYVLQRTIWIHAFAHFLKSEALWQPIRIKLVKVLTLIALHAQVPEPVSTY